MAEVSNLRRFHVQTLSTRADAFVDEDEVEEEEEGALSPNLYAFDFDSVYPPNPSFLIPSNNDNFDLTNISEPDSGTREYESVHSDQNFFFYGPDDEEDDDEQMNFVTDLFARQGVSGEPDNFELGLESECNRVTIPSQGGLRIVNMDSESDSEAVEVDSGFDVVNRDGLDSNDDLGLPGFLDWLQFDSAGTRASSNEEFEWEEVNVRENLSSLIDRIEEISVSSDGENSPFDNGGEEGEDDDVGNARNAEWQVLLAVNNLELPRDFDEYNVLFGELVEAESNIKGSPPAAKSVVENLPSVVLTIEDLTRNNVVCAVCKDEVCLGVKVTRLPCCHHYHQDCIVPWLSIRNTCPLCRYELPTDDVDYERRKNRNGGDTGLVGDLEVRYIYELLP
ncbi:hypothetical protein ACH5RR_011311 [Cinchona calisaya]|uniref:RING-type E3 ubiquitin transferase n=1 Tax=Cinchona calisaya TaxID=153742 RepID=A0ABD3A4I3_9GENT